MIAYLAKDRQDASKAGLCKVSDFSNVEISGSRNTNVISGVTKNIVKNSMGKPYLKMDREIYNEICQMKDKNSKKYIMRIL